MKYANVKTTAGPRSKRRMFNRILTQEFNRYLREHPEEIRRIDKQAQVELLKQYL